MERFEECDEISVIGALLNPVNEELYKVFACAYDLLKGGDGHMGTWKDGTYIGEI